MFRPRPSARIAPAERNAAPRAGLLGVRILANLVSSLSSQLSSTFPLLLQYASQRYTSLNSVQTTSKTYIVMERALFVKPRAVKRVG